MMDGCVKTLHPKIHVGILAARHDEDVMRANDITPIDLIVVNLYPFAAMIARDDCTDELAIENIDIGGPAMVRSGAKNHASVLTVTILPIIQRIAALQNGAIDDALRRAYAVKHFAIRRNTTLPLPVILARRKAAGFLTLTYDKMEEMRYGENPH